MKKWVAYLGFLFLGMLLAGFLHIYQINVDRHDALAQTEKKISQLGRLVLFEQYYRAVLTIENTQKIFDLPFQLNRMLLAVPYRVRYGIDMGKGINLYHKGDTLIVEHPSPEIFDIDVVHNEIETFVTKGRVHIDDFMPIINKEKLALVDKLNEEYADVVSANLQNFFTQFLIPLEFKKIEFEVIQT